VATTGQAQTSPSGHSAVLPYAGFSLRAVAFILDLIVVASCFLLFFAVAFLPAALGSDSKLSGTEEKWAYIVLLTYIPFVPFLFFTLWTWRGQSIGMIAVRIEVTDRDGEPLSAARALVRALVWPLCMLPFGIGAIPVLFDDERRALQDMIAGTVVLELP
jgi:uncharacterized RDD family membrane protein YckC